MEKSNRIRELRRERGLTQQELAEETGLSVHAINSYESGRRQPNSKAMAVLEQFFNVSGSFLRGETSDPAPMAWQFNDIMEEISSSYGVLFRDMETRLQNAPPKVQKLCFDIFVELRAVLSSDDLDTLDRTVDMLEIALTRSTMFLTALSDTTPENAQGLATTRGRVLVDIGDTMLDLQRRHLDRFKDT